MRIALVSEHASPLAVLGGVDAGGQNVHVAALAHGLARLGHEVVVHTRRDAPDLPHQVRMAPGVVVEHVVAGPPRPVPKDDLLPFMGDFADDLHRSWAARRPDVVHAHFWMSGLASLAAAQPLGLPVVQTFHALGAVKLRHQGDRDTSPRQRLAIESGILQAVDRVIATCRDEVVELERLGGERDRIEVIPCGVDLRHFRPDGPRERRPAGGPARVVVVSRLVERKGVGNVIRAMADVPGAELIVAGGPDVADLDDDPEAARLRRLARRHGVSSRVHLRGRVDRADLPALLRSADVVACVPWYEPFGIVPIEAMACGVPVVASAVGGLLDTVVDGGTGVHVPPRQPEAVAAALCRLLADDRLRRRLGRAGAAQAATRYGWGLVSRATEDVLRQVAQEALVASPGRAS
jgi:D-inositol-3-phosphate glycosyltransferase